MKKLVFEHGHWQEVFVDVEGTNKIFVSTPSVPLKITYGGEQNEGQDKRRPHKGSRTNPHR